MNPRIRTAARKLVETFGLIGPAFRIQERVRAFGARADVAVTADDGLPVPDAHLIVLVGGHGHARAFLDGGREVADAVRAILAAHGVRLEQLRAILDFGSGCGRVLRYWRDLAPAVAIHGTDYNRKGVDWCNAHLPFARSAVNRLQPPLDYADGQFDLVYAFSVFTHLSADLQVQWIHELARVTAPGGHVLITVHGDSFRAAMSTPEQAQFDAGELVVRYSQMAGSNLCAAFHPRAYLAAFAPELELVEHLPARLGQDVVLFRKTLP